MASLLGRDEQNVGVLSDIFELDCKKHRLTVNSTSLSWHKDKKPSYETCIPLSEVIAVYTGSVADTPSNLETLLSTKWWKRKDNFCLSSDQTSFLVHYVERAWKHRWKLRSLRFYHSDPNTVIQWVSHIQEILDNFKHRPKRLLVFINPFGGRKLANKIYEEKVRPLFELANVDARVIVTERANHAKDLLQEMPLAKLDGVICVGGDGMFSELLNGLLLRTQTENGVDSNNTKASLRRPLLRLGVIPGGSTDALAFCTTGVNDPVTSTLHIIVGDSVGVDVCGVYSEGKLARYATTGIGYGYLGDTLIDSEKHRWMGPTRYDYSGTIKFLQNRTYEGELLFRLAPQSASSPHDQTKCTTGCKICEKDIGVSDQQDEENFDVFGWRGVRGKFVAINLATVSCACARTKRGLSPSAHLGDGYADVIVVNQCSRLNFLRYLFATAFQRDSFRFPFINVHRVCELQFRPLGAEDTANWPANASSLQHFPCPGQNPPRSSVWNIDGEIFENAALHVKAHRQLIRVFARGVEDFAPVVSCIPCSDSGMQI